MNAKKIFLGLFTVASALVLVACGPGKVEKPVDNRISLSYADWGDVDFNTQMIEAFESKYPHISVELRTDIAGSGEEFTGNLIEAAKAGLLPDVFATDNVPTIIKAGLTKDVSEYWDKDEDAKMIYEHMANTALYNGKRYAVPSFQFLKGIMINLDIFDRLNLTTVPGKYRVDDNGYPVKDWNFLEMVEIAKAVKNISSDPADTVAGLDTWYGWPDFTQVWPMMTNQDLQYDSWDGEKFNYESKDWIDAMIEKVKLHQLTDGTTTLFTPEMITEYPHLDGYLMQTGLNAMDIEGSWAFWLIQDSRDNNMNLGFWPYPRSPKGDFNPPVVLDYQAVSSQTEHPEEAYLLAKWMTYGQDGWNTRLDILEEEREELEAEGKVVFLDRYPIADYPGVWDRVDKLVEGIEGIDEIFKHIDKAKPDLDKWMPGYRDFNQWINAEDNPYTWDNLVAAGPAEVAAYAKEWNKKINEIVKQELDAIK